MNLMLAQRRVGAGRYAVPVEIVVRSVACAAIAYGVLVCGLLVANRADWGGAARSRAALGEVAVRDLQARRLLAAASANRASARRTGPVEVGDVLARLVLRLADLAEASGLRIRELDRLAVSHDGGPADGPRADWLKLSAEGDFTAIQRFVAGLASLPVLVVPAALTVQRGGRAGVIEVRLAVFAALPPGRGEVVADRGDLRHVDPFADTSTGAGPSARLVGVLRDRRLGLAMFELDDSAWLIAEGQRFGDERIARIDIGGVTLAKPGSTRRVSMAEAG